MQPSLEYQIEQAIRRAGHRSNAYDTGWDNFLSQVPDLLAKAVENTDEIPIAIEIVFARVSGTSRSMADGDHHSPTYGEEIGHYFRETGPALKLAQDTAELQRLIKAKKEVKGRNLETRVREALVHACQEKRWDLQPKSFIEELPGLITKAIDNAEQIPAALEVVLSRVRHISITRRVSDHHAYDYGEEYDAGYDSLVEALELARNTGELRQLVKQRTK